MNSNPANMFTLPCLMRVEVLPKIPLHHVSPSTTTIRAWSTFTFFFFKKKKLFEDVLRDEGCERYSRNHVCRHIDPTTIISSEKAISVLAMWAQSWRGSRLINSWDSTVAIQKWLNLCSISWGEEKSDTLFRRPPFSISIKTTWLMRNPWGLSSCVSGMIRLRAFRVSNSWEQRQFWWVWKPQAQAF